MIGYEETQLGQELATLAENGELELPDDDDVGYFTAKDYAIAIESHLGQIRRNAIRALTNNQPGELRRMAKHLTRHCDMPKCDMRALPDDIFCRHHRAVEDAMIVETQYANDLPF